MSSIENDGRLKLKLAEADNNEQPRKKLKSYEDSLPKDFVPDNSGCSEVNQNEEDTVVNADVIDPLAYTKTGAFTSEVFKIMICNVPLYASPADTKKFLKKHHLDPVKVKRAMKTNFAYITFRNEEGRQDAMKILKGLVWKKNILTVSLAEPDKNPFANGRSKDADHRTVKEKTAPLHEMDYDKQLETKLHEIQSVLDGYKKSLCKAWPTSFPEQNYNFIVQTVKPSPSTQGYRNKCEFSIGKNVETNDSHCVGFVKGQFQSGNISIEEPYECVEVCPNVMFEEVRRFKEYLITSEFPTYDNIANIGVWKSIEMRTTSDGSVMITPVVDKRQLDYEKLQKLKSTLINVYEKQDKCSLFLKLVGGKEQIFHLSGPEFMLEKLCGYDFQITSGSFFQVNTSAAEVLYQTIADTASLDTNTHLLDICCGTGTIGIILSKYVKQVYGIELVESAVKDARKNATRNSIENISFFAGNAKVVTPRVCKQIPKGDATRVVAIVDPPRSGLHLDVISCLRKNTMIKEIVYVSCDIRQITNNIVSLCGPTSTKYPEDPFQFVSAVAVDLFPHTKKYEVILYFKR